MNECQTKRVTVFFFQDEMVMDRILVVDDDRAIQKALKRLFETDGYKVEIRGDGNSALEAFRTVAPTAIILDLRLPIVSGREVCREIRRQSSAVPIVVLSAATDVLDKVTLFEMGADDYVTKPFSPRELLARVRAAIRHTHRIDTCELATFDGVRVDFTKMEATFDGRAVGLTNHEFNLIKFFSQNAERVISRDELLTEACGYEVHSTLRTVDNHIWKLRQKLERDPENPIHFLTIRRSRLQVHSLVRITASYLFRGIGTM